MKRSIRALLAGLGLDVRRHRPDPLVEKVVSIEAPRRGRQGRVLISYSVAPFLVSDEADVTNRHTDDWECLQMARAFLRRGYSVDVIHFRNTSFIPRRRYAFLIDVGLNMQRLAQRLNPDCVKILHVVWAHWLFHNWAEYARYAALQRRRGVALRPRRQLPPNTAIELADCATVLGNQFTLDTFSYANKPMYRVPISATNLYRWPAGRSYEQCRRRFLWLGSSGLVHKGLDLTLEAFADLPDFELTVCGPLDRDAEFARLYHHELYELPNIHAVGWIDVGSEQFSEIAAQCIGVVFPSCSEGGGGSVVQCMHAALIPVVTYQTSVDAQDFGVQVTEPTVEAVREAVCRLAALPVEELEQRARRAWQYARDHHTRELFAENYERALDRIIQTTRPIHTPKRNERSIGSQGPSSTAAWTPDRPPGTRQPPTACP